MVAPAGIPVNSGGTAAAADTAGFDVARGLNPMVNDNPMDAGAPLGIHTKFVSASKSERKAVIRRRRWVEHIDTGDPRLARFAQLAYLREYLPNEHRTKFCLARLGFERNNVELVYNDDQKARFHGAAVCSSVWACPVCAERITAIRRSDLKHLLAITDYRVVMVTYTMEHHLGEALKPMVGDLNKAIRNMKKSRAWRRLAEKWGLVGHIQALETTYGLNGWHPHRHEILILDPAKLAIGGEEAKKVYENELQREIYELYYRQLVKVGRSCDQVHGVKVSANRHEYGKYITKWGVSEELTRSTSKLASNGGKSVWELLTEAVKGDLRSWALYLEYIEAFKGRKQLHWSEGLRELLGLGEEVSDEEAAEVVPGPEDRTIVTFHRLGWYALLEADLLGLIIKLANETGGDQEAVIRFLRMRGINSNHFAAGPPVPGYNGP